MGIHRPNRSPSQRYRFEQFQVYLEANGFEFDYFYLIEASDDKKFYGAGNYVAKLWLLVRSVFRLFWVSLRAGKYDMAFVQREAFMLGTVFFERWIAKKTKMIFDFDDAIWLQNVSAGNKALSFLKDASKTAKLIEISDMIFAGNSYLVDYGKQFNSNTKLIPTVVDTNNYSRQEQAPRDSICIGWSGSFSTIPYFELALPALKRLKEKYGDKIYFKVIGDANYYNKDLDIKGTAWTSASEVFELSEIDIGIMPLPDDEWTKGKCALKGLLYMSLGQPAVLSDVGVNGEVIEDGVSGFLVKNEDEWVEKISRLIDDEALRKKIGEAGRQRAIEEYSVASLEKKYVELFNEVING